MLSNTASETNSSRFLDLLTQNRSPSSIAGGVAFGVMLGLVPKDNLLALLLLVLIAVLPINQLVAYLLAFVGMMLGGLTAAPLDWVGFQVLKQTLVGDFLSALYQIPLVPWLRLENTLVAGSLVTGVLLWIPTYLIVQRASTRIYRSISSNEVSQLAAASLRHASTREASKQQSVPKEVTQRTEHLETEDLVSTPGGKGLAKVEGRASHRREATFEHALKHASQQAQNLYDNSTRLPVPSTTTQSDRTVGQATAKSSNDLQAKNDSGDMEESILRETLIEVIRFKDPVADSPQKKKSDLLPTPDMEPMQITNIIQQGHSPSSTNKEKAESTTAVLPSSGSSHYRSHVGTKEGSLRHILKHIHGSRDTKKEVGPAQ